MKANDAAAMDRILADDMVLITGRGKVFTKADLLKDARDKTTIYEKQDELEQKVRVCGDTRPSSRLSSGSRARARARPPSASSGSATPT